MRNYIYKLGIESESNYIRNRNRKLKCVSDIYVSILVYGLWCNIARGYLWSDINQFDCNQFDFNHNRALYKC